MSWKAAGGLASGPGHLVSGFECQDSYAYRVLQPDNIVAIAIADGAGSAPHSAIGARAAVQFVTNENRLRGVARELAELQFTDSLDGGTSVTDGVDRILRSFFVDTAHQVNKLALTNGLTFRDLNTTLTFGLLTPTLSYLAEIGDGIVAIQTEAGVKTILQEDKSDQPINATTFLQELSRDPSSDCFRSASVPELLAVAISSDGLQYQATLGENENWAVSPSFFEPIWRNVASGAWSNQEISEWLAAIPEIVQREEPSRNTSSFTDDDKTLVAAVRIAQHEPGDALAGATHAK